MKCHEASRGRAAAVGVLVSAVLSALIAAPVAGATVDLYLDEVRANVDAPLTDAEALQLGNVACDAMRAGLAEGLTFGKARHQADQAVGYAQSQLGLNLSMADGMFLVEAAEDSSADEMTGQDWRRKSG
jgi:hypothetical protein